MAFWPLTSSSPVEWVFRYLVFDHYRPSESARLPCSKQIVILPEEIMFVPKQFQFSQKTILPNNGLLLFDEGQICVIFCGD